MKKNMVTVIIIISLIVPVLINPQGSNYSLTMERKDLHNEKKELRKEEKTERRDKRATDRTEVSYFTKNSFSNDFPQAKDIGYTVGKNFDEVLYRLENRNYIAITTGMGNW